MILNLASFINSILNHPDDNCQELFKQQSCLAYVTEL